MNWMKRHEWWIVGVLACLAFALGYAGIASHYSVVGVNAHPLDVIYAALHFYSVSYPIEPTEGGFLAAPNAMVQIARFLAPATIAYSLFRLVAAAIGDAASKLSVAGYTDHAVVCGAGEMGFVTVTSLLSLGHRVLVVDPFLNGSHLGEMRATGAKVIVGSALDGAVLKRARIASARYVALVTGDESVNFAVAGKCVDLVRLRRQERYSGKSLVIRAHASRDFADVFEGVRPFGMVNSAVDVRFFDSAHTAARQIALKLSVEHSVAIAATHAEPKLLIIGDGRFTSSLTSMVLRQMQLPGCKPPLIDVISTNLDSILEHFPHAHPQLGHVGSVHFHEKSHGQLLSDEFMLKDSQMGEEYDLIILALEDAFACIKLSRSVIQKTMASESGSARTAVPSEVAVCLKPTAALNGVEAHLTADRYGRIFNVTELSCCGQNVFDEVLDAGAQAAHESYLKNNAVIYDPARPGTAPWSILKEEFKAANRRTIDHDLVKKSFLKTDSSEKMIDALAESEHRSWMADRVLAGWRKGPVRDDSKKLHPSIVPYQELNQSEQGKDIEKVQRLGET